MQSSAQQGQCERGTTKEATIAITSLAAGEGSCEGQGADTRLSAPVSPEEDSGLPLRSTWSV